MAWEQGTAEARGSPLLQALQQTTWARTSHSHGLENSLKTDTAFRHLPVSQTAPVLRGPG